MYDRRHTILINIIVFFFFFLDTTGFLLRRLPYSASTALTAAWKPSASDDTILHIIIIIGCKTWAIQGTDFGYLALEYHSLFFYYNNIWLLLLYSIEVHNTRCSAATIGFFNLRTTTAEITINWINNVRTLEWIKSAL